MKKKKGLRKREVKEEGRTVSIYIFKREREGKKKVKKGMRAKKLHAKELKNGK
jgi:hypothetical protein